MYNSRRTFLRASLAVGSVAVATAAGLLTPRSVLAAWPKQAFAAEEMDAAIQAITGMASATPSDKIMVRTPDIAENGAVVSVTVQHSLPNAETISILVPENNNKLAASYKLSDQINSFVTGRIKMRKTSDVIAVVKADGKLYSGKGHVKVTLGGCGG
jgi:sulfur-oxidizing protein SoxY